MLKIGKIKIKNPGCSCADGRSDESSFRILVRRYGAGLAFTGDDRRWRDVLWHPQAQKRVRDDDEDKPVVAQLFGGAKRHPIPCSEEPREKESKHHRPERRMPFAEALEEELRRETSDAAESCRRACTELVSSSRCSRDRKNQDRLGWGECPWGCAHSRGRRVPLQSLCTQGQQKMNVQAVKQTGT